jgi:hypothetical protein
LIPSSHYLLWSLPIRQSGSSSLTQYRGRHIEAIATSANKQPHIIFGTHTFHNALPMMVPRSGGTSIKPSKTIILSTWKPIRRRARRWGRVKNQNIAARNHQCSSSPHPESRSVVEKFEENLRTNRRLFTHGLRGPPCGWCCRTRGERT